MSIDILDWGAKTVGDDGTRKPPPIPCLGRWTHTSDGSDFDCDYENSGHFGCEDCIVNEGLFDPRTGKKYRGKVKR